MALSTHSTPYVLSGIACAIHPLIPFSTNTEVDQYLIVLVSRQQQVTFIATIDRTKSCLGQTLAYVFLIENSTQQQHYILPDSYDYFECITRRNTAVKIDITEQSFLINCVSV